MRRRNTRFESVVVECAKFLPAWDESICTANTFGSPARYFSTLLRPVRGLGLGDAEVGKPRWQRLRHATSASLTVFTALASLTHLSEQLPSAPLGAEPDVGRGIIGGP